MLGVEMWQHRYLIEHPENADEPRDDHRGALDLTGYSVEALDGPLGKVDQASYELDGSAIVVDTGPWIFGKKVLIPSGIIDRVDVAEETVGASHQGRDQGLTTLRRRHRQRQAVPDGARRLLRARRTGLSRVHHRSTQRQVMTVP